MEAIAKDDPVLTTLNTSTNVLDYGVWTQAYDKSYVTQYGNLYLVVDEISFDIHQNFSQPNIDIEQYLPQAVTTEIFLSISRSLDGGWSSFQLWPGQDENSTTPAKLHIGRALAAENNLQSRMQISLPFMIVVVTFNLFKFVIMVGILIMDSSDYLVTLGDTAASYLKDPEILTKDRSILDLDRMPSSFESPQSKDNCLIVWQPRRRRYCSSIGYDKTWSAIMASVTAVQGYTVGLTLVQSHCVGLRYHILPHPSQ